MKRKIVKMLPLKLREKVSENSQKRNLREMIATDSRRFIDYSFGHSDKVSSFNQLEARLTKAYHSIEKGLSYKNVRLGFGETALNNLISLMESYIKQGYSKEAEVYNIALSNLYAYIELHEANSYNVDSLKEKVNLLGNLQNETGGIKQSKRDSILARSEDNFESFALSRHSIRDFSNIPVELNIIEKALILAQSTPSACNRQGWQTRIVTDQSIKKIIQDNQNGNKGFGDAIDKFIVVTTDTQYFAKPRERNQPYIDGGMYSMNLLYSLHYYGIASVPLSASLTLSQENQIRKVLKIQESEVFILIIGIGNYIEDFKYPKSTRRAPSFSIH